MNIRVSERAHACVGVCVCVYIQYRYNDYLRTKEM